MATAEAIRADVAAVLGREPWDHAELPIPAFSAGERILITGGDGFIGRHLRDVLSALSMSEIASLDIVDDDDILDEGTVGLFFRASAPTYVFHLAAHKDAPAGEEIPAAVADLNVRGTDIICRAATDLGRSRDRACRVVLASTCKAADPVTAYGASKLIAERIVLNAGGAAVRLVNVAGSSRSVLETWARDVADDLPLDVAADCRRGFITPDEAVRLLLLAATLPSGVYAPRAVFVSMLSAVRRAYPDHPCVQIKPRWGDRLVEHVVGRTEWAMATDYPAVIQIQPEWREGRERHALPEWDLPGASIQAGLRRR